MVMVIYVFCVLCGCVLDIVIEFSFNIIYVLINYILSVFYGIFFYMFE